MAKRIVTGSCSTPLNVQEFENFAEEYLPKNAFDYYASGANDEISLKENRMAFQRLRIIPRALRDVSIISTKCTILGQVVETPICAAPTAMHKMAHPQGELATARACAQVQNCMILSSLSTTSLEEVATANGVSGLKWFQLYIYKDRDLTLKLVKRAETAGYKALVLTVDTPLLGQRESDVRNRFHLPTHLSLGNFTNLGGEHAFGVKSTEESGLSEYVASLFDQTLSWKDVKWLKSATKLPLVLKGILSPEDAKMAVQMGCEGILVSNHGARQLDGVPSTIEALSGIVDAVGNKAEVYLDGGVRRGTDAFKALAIGAKAVFVGRPVLWALAHSGEEGVVNMFNILLNELRMAMMFAGVKNISGLSKEYIKHESYFRQSSL